MLTAIWTEAEKKWKRSRFPHLFLLWLVLILGRNAQGNPDEIARKIKQITWLVSTDLKAQQIDRCVAILIVNQRRDLSVRGILKSQISNRLTHKGEARAATYPLGSSTLREQKCRRAISPPGHWPRSAQARPLTTRAGKRSRCVEVSG